MPEKTPLPRNRELAARQDSRLVRDLLKEYGRIERGFADQKDREEEQQAYWNCYNCELDENQFYNGESQTYLPIVYDALEARKTRFLNQLFPPAGHYVDATSTDENVPRAEIALLEHYIRAADLEMRVMPALCLNGDVEGQYNLYVDWDEVTRHVVSRETSRGASPQAPGGGIIPGEPELVEDIHEEDIIDAGPAVEVLHDWDVLVLPSTADSVEDALEKGGSVVIRRRWTRDQVEAMTDDGHFIDARAEMVQIAMDAGGSQMGRSQALGDLASAAGVKIDKGMVFGYEVWKKLSVPGEEGKRLCRAYLGGSQLVLGCKLNPFWNDRCPLLSYPQQKQAGVFKGAMALKKAACLQWAANDMLNEGFDSSHYAMMPIVTYDPERQPKNLIINLAAVWDIKPGDVAFLQFPDMWQRVLPPLQAIRAQIFETLSVSPAMLTQQAGRPGAKRNQAEVAMEQQAELLSISQNVKGLSRVADALLLRFIEYDHQFRDEDLEIETWGEMGHELQVEKVPPLQLDKRIRFFWSGIEQARFAQHMQQQIAYINVLRGVQQQIEQAGYKIDIAAVLVPAATNLFGARMARRLIRDRRQEMGLDPELENRMLELGHAVHVHLSDNDQKHIAAHFQLLQEMGGDDPMGVVLPHIQLHQQKMQAMQAMAMMRMLQQGAPGVPGGAGPGVAGTPRGTPPGANPAMPRPNGPPGMVHGDNLRLAMPRKV